MLLLPRPSACSLRTPSPFLRLKSFRLFSRSVPSMDQLKHKMAGLTPFAKKHKVTVIGSGNWYVRAAAILTFY